MPLIEELCAMLPELHYHSIWAALWLWKLFDVAMSRQIKACLSIKYKFSRFLNHVDFSIMLATCFFCIAVMILAYKRLAVPSYDNKYMGRVYIISTGDLHCIWYTVILIHGNRSLLGNQTVFANLSIFVLVSDPWGFEPLFSFDRAQQIYNSLFEVVLQLPTGHIDVSK